MGWATKSWWYFINPFPQTKNHHPTGQGIVALFRGLWGRFRRPCVARQKNNPSPKEAWTTENHGSTQDTSQKRSSKPQVYWKKIHVFFDHKTCKWPNWIPVLTPVSVDAIFWYSIKVCIALIKFQWPTAVMSTKPSMKPPASYSSYWPPTCWSLQHLA